VIKYFNNIHKALGLIPSNEINNRKKEGGKEGGREKW
jgi:hypothetical protein